MPAVTFPTTSNLGLSSKTPLLFPVPARALPRGQSSQSDPWVWWSVACPYYWDSTKPNLMKTKSNCWLQLVACEWRKFLILTWSRMWQDLVAWRRPQPASHRLRLSRAYQWRKGTTLFIADLAHCRKTRGIVAHASHRATKGHRQDMTDLITESGWVSLNAGFFSKNIIFKAT